MDVVGVVGVVVEVCWSLLAIVLVFGFGLVLESALMPFFVVVPLASRPAARPLHRVSGGTKDCSCFYADPHNAVRNLPTPLLHETVFAHRVTA